MTARTLLAQPGKGIFLCRPLRIMKMAYCWLTRAGDLGCNPFPIPMARNSVPYNDQGCNAYVIGPVLDTLCPVDGKNGTQNTVIPAAIKSGNCELRTYCKVAEILMGDNGKAIGVRYFDENDKERTPNCRYYSNCCCSY
jgi:hypothetical protein